MQTQTKLLFICILMFLSILPLYAQLNVTYQGDLPYTQGINDIWGYEDASGNEYALVGTQTGTSIVDISNPTTPTEIHFIPGTSSTWRDLKTWGTRAYVTTEANDQLLIIDLSNLPGGTITSTITNLGVGYTSAHNIFIDENGVGYLFGTNLNTADGALMIDIASNPANPIHLGNYDAFYIHDGFARNDVLWGSHIYAGHFGAIDVSNKSAPVVMATQTTDKVFTHACWLSDNNQTLFTVDERNDAPVESWDVSNLSNIRLLDTYKAHAGTSVTPHNVFVRGDFVVVSYYTAGVIILDSTHPHNLIQVGYYDTSPASGSGFSGCWGTYPFFDSGTLLATDRQEGLFVLTPNYTKACYLEGIVTSSITGFPVVGATVTLSDPLAMTEITDLGGNYATGTVTPGSYMLQVSAPGYISQTITVTFSGGCNGNMSTQDVALVPTNIPCSSGPMGISASAITNNQATISWTSDANAVGYTVRYRIQGTATWTTLNTIGNSVNLTGLNPNTIYEFEVQIDCGSGTTSVYSGTNTFTTLEQCDPPSSIALMTSATNFLDISWTMATNATDVIVEYQEVGTTTWQTVSVSGTNFSITNLTPCTDYNIRVLSNCGNSLQTSIYSNTQTYTTATPTASLTSSVWQDCLGTINLNALILTGDTGGTWSGGNYISAAGIFDPSGLTVGFYSVIYTISGGNCTISDNNIIAIHSDPNAAWSPPSTNLRNCDGSFDLNNLVTGTANGNWSGGSYVSSTGMFTPTTLAPGNYSVTYQAGFGICSDVQSYNVTVEDCPTLQLKVMLEGNYTGSSTMNNNLQSSGLVPMAQSYNVAPWNYGGSESATSLPSNAVDWVLVELRDPAYNLVDRAAGILLQNGDVVNATGNPNLVFFNAAMGTNYHVVVRHRNHLDVMSANTITLPNTYDFTTGIGQAFGTQQMKDLGGGVYGLYAGDHNNNGVISVADFNDFSAQISQINVYLNADTNLDGTISVADFNQYRNNASVIGIIQIRY